MTVVPGMGRGGRGHAQQQAVSPGGVTRVTESGRFGVIRGRWLKQKVLFLGHHDSREDGAHARGGCMEAKFAQAQAEGEGFPALPDT